VIKPGLALWFAAAAVLAAFGFLTGRALHPGAEAHHEFETDTAPYTPAEAVAGFSKGGFTGFGEITGFEGRTVLGGRIVAADPSAVTLETRGGVQTSMRLAGPPPLQVLQASDRGALRPGVTLAVIVTDGSDEAVSVLVLSPP
jgi:hypothetical protein